MNTFFKVMIAIMAACNHVMTLFTPIFIALMWAITFGTATFGDKLIIILASIATVYRGIKMIIGNK